MAENSDSSRRAATRGEASRIHESAKYCAQGQYEAAKRWRLQHWTLGVACAGLGTVGAILTFADCSQILAGTLTFLAAIVAAVLTGVRPDKLAERAQTTGNEYMTLRNDTRRFMNIYLANCSDDEASARLEVLADRASELDHSSDPIPQWAYERAKTNISQGGQDFEADES
ncbi:hypothetical protein ABH922_001806 [Rhodococcus sp. 27YEA15]|uniref:SLATT domain-containing protein n=1 Tax=Rhodococcus sp. 27YEA15 TaxID=3156259 RepID=UPI003C7E7CC4